MAFKKKYMVNGLIKNLDWTKMCWAERKKRNSNKKEIELGFKPIY